jgi:hypothetical protein
MYKEWYARKTTWAGITSIVGGLGSLLTDEISMGVGLVTILGGLAAIFMRSSIEDTKWMVEAILDEFFVDLDEDEEEEEESDSS